MTQTYPVAELAATCSTISSFVAVATLIYRHAFVRPAMVARECLITSMLVAGLINSINTMVQTLSYLGRVDTPPRGSAACTTAGFLAQMSVQALDLNLLAITLITTTVLTKRSDSMRILSFVSKWLWYMLAVIWGIPVTTGTAAHFIVGYAPAGVWCWIADSPLPLASYIRYGFTLGPRIGVFVIMAICYSVVFVILWSHKREVQRAFKKPSNENFASQKPSDGSAPPHLSDNLGSVRSSLASNARTQSQDHIIRSMILLSLHPIFYLILYFPLILNRTYEAIGAPSRLLLLLQGLSWLLPAANCLVWIVTEHFRTRSGSVCETEEGRKVSGEKRTRVKETLPRVQMTRAASANPPPELGHFSVPPSQKRELEK
ncbi:hypothetical protein BJ742DRAFT_489686 [Cladochytrium replicatum]|nr:hypothetical protein BJ742DRAFT_489686 [Cladochytrium replicatum]